MKDVSPTLQRQGKSRTRYCETYLCELPLVQDTNDNTLVRRPNLGTGCLHRISQLWQQHSQYLNIYQPLYLRGVRGGNDNKAIGYHPWIQHIVPVCGHGIADESIDSCNHGGVARRVNMINQWLVLLNAIMGPQKMHPIVLDLENSPKQQRRQITASALKKRCSWRFMHLLLYSFKTSFMRDSSRCSPDTPRWSGHTYTLLNLPST